MNHAVRHATTVLVVIVTCGTMIVATFGEYALGVLGPTFDRELGISTSMIGVLTAIMFGTAGVFSFFIGPMVDRLHPAKLSFWLIVLSGVALVSFYFVGSESGLIFTCVLLGALASLCTPLTNKLVSAYLPPSAHATAISWKSLGPQLGALFAGLAFGGMAELFDWRKIIITLAIVMVLFGIYCWVSLRNCESYRAPVAGIESPGGQHRLAEGIIEEEKRTEPIVWWLIAWSFFFGGAISSVGAYIPAYADRAMDMPLALAGAAGGLIAGISVLARFVWVYFLRFTDFVTVLVLAGFSSALATVLLAMAPSLGPGAFWLAIVLVGATALGVSPVVAIVLVGATNPRQIGFISAMNGVGVYAGFTFQPLVIGYIMDNYDFALSWYFMAASAFVAALVIVAYALVHGKPRGPYLSRASRSSRAPARTR